MITEEISRLGKSKIDNKMREPYIEKVVLSCSGVKEILDKQVKLLKKISKMEPSKRQTRKRIPSFGIRPKLEIGCVVTLRGKKATELLKRLLASIDNQLNEKQISDNHLSFGIHEYIEIPGEEYDREIGMMGLNVTIVFSRKGKRVNLRRKKRQPLPLKQMVTRDEIIKFMEDNFGTEIE